MELDKNAFLIDKLEEKIYFGTDKNHQEELKAKLNEFLSVLISRRRDDPIEEGLQAEMIIMPETFAAKVNEKDGLSTHLITKVNLLRFIKHKNTFYIDKAGGYNAIIHDEIEQLTRDGIDIRILDGETEAIFAINSIRKCLSDFQINILKTLITLLKEIQQDNIYSSVEVGLDTANSKVDIDNINEEKYQELITALEDEREKTLSIQDIKQRTEKAKPEDKNKIITSFRSLLKKIGGQRM